MVGIESSGYRILFVTPEEANVSLLKQGLVITTVASFEVEGAGNFVRALSKIEQFRPDLVLYDLQIGGGCDLAGAARILGEHPEIPLVVMTDEPHEAEASKALELGCEDVFVKGWAVDGGARRWRDALAHDSADPIMKGVTDGSLLARELVHAIHRHRARAPKLEKPAKAKREPRGLISFIGSKGGVGTTTVALGVATLIDPDPTNVVMVEIDPMRAVLPAMLRLTNGRSLAELLEPTRLRTEKLEEVMSSLEGGPFILTGRTDPPRATTLTDHAETLVQAMKSLYSFVVLDVTLDHRGEVRKFLDASDIICLVMDPDPVSASSAQWMLRMFTEWGIPEDKVCILPVISRPGSCAGARLHQLARFLKRRMLGLIPYAGDECQGAIAEKLPVTQYRPESALTEALRALATELRGMLEGLPAAPKEVLEAEAISC